MKCFFVILAAIALADGAKTSSSTRGLHADFQDFKALYPFDELAEVRAKYSKDKHYVAVKNYLKSKEAVKAEEAVLSAPEIDKLMQWIDDNFDDYVSGRNVSSEIHTSTATTTTTTVKPHKYDFHKKHKKDKKISSRSSSAGFNGYVQEIIDLIPMYEFRQLIQQKKRQNGAFAEFYKRMHGIEEVVKGLIKLPEVAKFVKHLEKMEVDVEFPWEVVRRFFGWT